MVGDEASHQQCELAPRPFSSMVITRRPHRFKRICQSDQPAPDHSAEAIFGLRRGLVRLRIRSEDMVCFSDRVFPMIVKTAQELASPERKLLWLGQSLKVT
jgi:hypothetical protein